MNKKPVKFDADAKARISRAESNKHGHIRKGSFSRDVQSKVDKQAATGVPEPKARKSPVA